MKIRNLVFMPFAVALDVVTVGTLEVTKKIVQSDRNERQLEAELELIRLLSMSKKD